MIMYIRRTGGWERKTDQYVGPTLLEGRIKEFSSSVTVPREGRWMPSSGQNVVLVMVLAIGGIDTKGELPNLLKHKPRTIQTPYYS